MAAVELHKSGVYRRIVRRLYAAREVWRKPRIMRNYKNGGGGNRTRVRKRSVGESTYLSGSDLSRTPVKGTCKLAGTPAR